jgi:hypothetical protein
VSEVITANQNNARWDAIGNDISSKTLFDTMDARQINHCHEQSDLLLCRSSDVLYGAFSHRVWIIHGRNRRVDKKDDEDHW